MGGSKRASKDLLTDDEIKYWLLDKSHRDHCWIVEHQIADVAKESSFLHLNNVGIDTLAADGNTFKLKYTYCAHVTTKSLVALVEDVHGHFCVIRNNKSFVPKDEDDEDEGSEEEALRALETSRSRGPETFDSRTASARSKAFEIAKASTTDTSTTGAEPAKPVEPEELNDENANVVIDSTITYGNIRDLLKNLSDAERGSLGVVKHVHMKLKKEAKNTWTERLHIMQCADGFSEWLAKEAATDNVDFIGMFWLKPESFASQKPFANVLGLTLNQNFRMTRFDALLAVFPNLRQINLINMPTLSTEMVGHVCELLPELREFSMHFCPLTTIRIMLSLLKLKRIEKICLNQVDLACQQNTHSGLVGELEWQALDPCVSLQKLLINSTNMSLDALDYMLPKCPEVERVVLDAKVYESLAKNLVSRTPEPGLVMGKAFVIASLDNRNKKTVQRPFIIKNLMRDSVEQPFSDAMTAKSKDITARCDAEARGEHKTEEQELMEELIREMKANGELDSGDEV